MRSYSTSSNCTTRRTTRGSRGTEAASGTRPSPAQHASSTACRGRGTSIFGSTGLTTAPARRVERHLSGSSGLRIVLQRETADLARQLPNESVKDRDQVVLRADV